MKNKSLPLFSCSIIVERKLEKQDERYLIYFRDEMFFLIDK